jgi:hypothetical protein
MDFFIPGGAKTGTQLAGWTCGAGKLAAVRIGLQIEKHD